MQNKRLQQNAYKQPAGIRFSQKYYLYCSSINKRVTGVWLNLRASDPFSGFISIRDSMNWESPLMQHIKTLALETNE